MRWIPILALSLLAIACGGDDTTDETAPADTSETAMTPGGGATDPASDPATTTGGEATTATTAEATGAPSPPEGYAVESEPAAGGALATIEYLSPRTVTEVAQFYDGRIPTDRKVTLDVAGDDVVVYGLGGSTIGPATRIQDLERLLDQRSEPMVVVAPHQLPANDPLIGDLRDVGQSAQADALLQTKSKITVVYAP